MGSAKRSAKRRYSVKRKRRFGNQIPSKMDTTDDTVVSEPPVGVMNVPSTSSVGEPPMENIEAEGNVPLSSVSEPKSCNVDNESTNDFNFLINNNIMSQIVTLMNKPCTECNNYATRSLNIDPLKKHGLCQTIMINCSCGSSEMFTSSNRTDPDNKMSHFDINVRTVISFRELGLGHTAIVNFSRHMNMPPPMNLFSYQNIINFVHPMYIQAAEESMAKAASAIKKSDSNDPCDIIAS